MEDERGLNQGPTALGVPLGECRAAVVAIHGRGQTPAYLVEHLVQPLALEHVSFLLPAAPAGSWYPGRFDAPRGDNEPWIGQAIDQCESALGLVEAAGVEPARTVLVGFSQGACLATAVLARRPRALGGVAILTGALIGPPGDEAVVQRGLDGVPVVVTCSSMDAWVPLERARAAAEAFAAAGADVRFVPRDDPDHRISPGDVASVRELVLQAANGTIRP